MTNNFYVRTESISRNNTARAEQVSRELDAIEDGFDLLPDPDDLHGGSASFASTESGAADAYVVASANGPSTPTAGTHIAFYATSANTGASTLTYGDWAAKGLRRPNGDALSAGDIEAGALVEARYQGSYWTINQPGMALISAAEGHASTASTKATEAAASASAASSSASSASSSASSASSSASSASSSASSASTAQGAAETAQAAAETAQAAAETAETNAETAQAAAETAQTGAETAETNAAASASAASTSETNAAASESAAATSETNAAASFDSFDDRYLGAKSSDPSVDNDGNALVEGALVWNSVGKVFKAWNGSSWTSLSVSTAADAVTFSPAGDISAEDAQAAIEELDSEKLAKAGGTMSGELDMGDNLVTKPNLKDFSIEKYAISGTSGAQTVNLENGNVQTITATASITFTFSNWPASGDYGAVLLIVTDADNLGSSDLDGINWFLTDGTTSTTFSDLGFTLGSYHELLISTIDGGTTKYGWIS